VAILSEGLTAKVIHNDLWTTSQVFTKVRADPNNVAGILQGSRLSGHIQLVEEFFS